MASALCTTAVPGESQNQGKLMPDDSLRPPEFAATFKAFMDAMLAAVEPPRSPLQERLSTHLDTDTKQVPVVTEEFDNFEHPNLQVALDAYSAEPGRYVELVGLGLENRRFMALGLS